MPEPTTAERLRGLVLSASEIKNLTGWPSPMVEDYLNILESLITLADLLDIEIDQKIEEIETAFKDGSVPFVDDGFLVENNTSLFWDKVLKSLYADKIETALATLNNLTANRLTASNVNKEVISTDLFDWLDGTTNEIEVTDDGDGTITVSIPSGAVITFANTGLHILDTDASHDLIIKPGSDLTADRTLTLTTGDGNRIISVLGNLFVEALSTINQDVTTDAAPTFGGLAKVGDADNYMSVNATGDISMHGTAKIAWQKITADSITINGFTSGNTVADLRSFHDDNIYEMTETAGGDNWLVVEFINVTAFNWVKALLSYDGSSSHALHNQIYNWSTSSWETFDCNQDEFTDSGTIQCNKDYFVPNCIPYIGTGADVGKVRVRYNHTVATVNNHKVYINAVALYQ